MRRHRQKKKQPITKLFLSFTHRAVFYWIPPQQVGGGLRRRKSFFADKLRLKGVGRPSNFPGHIQTLADASKKAKSHRNRLRSVSNHGTIEVNTRTARFGAALVLKV